MGEWIVTDDPIGAVARPAGLRHANKAFAWTVGDDLMSHAYRAGDTVYGDRARPAIAGDDCFLARPVPDANPEAYSLVIRFLVAVTDTYWRVRQFNPDRTYNVLKSEFPEAWKLMGKYNR
jgi:hypothetical protein